VKNEEKSNDRVAEYKLELEKSSEIVKSSESTYDDVNSDDKECVNVDD
jgi:hypothetical protein